MTKISKQRYFLEIAFNGAAYHGWQIQENAMCVQEIMNNCIGMLLQEPVNCMGCGRTDARVHASSFFLHFSTTQEPGDLFEFRLQRLTPRDIRIKGLYKPREKGHARFSAIKRTYEYHISLIKDPFLINLATFYYGDLDLEKMNQAAETIIGTHDFSAFAKSGSKQTHGLCNVYNAGWEQNGNKVVFTISANRFLRRMVRMLVGTFIQTGTEKLTPEGFREILMQKDPGRSGKASPPDGLYLTNIDYPEGMLEKI